MNDLVRASLLALVTALVGCSDPVAPRGSEAKPPEAEPSSPPAEDATTKVAPTITVPASELVIEHPQAPAGQSGSYVAKLDPDHSEDGAPSMLLSADDDADTNGFAATTTSRTLDESLTGRRYRMRARIRSEDATSAWLWWRIDSEGSFLLDNMRRPVNRAIEGSTEWREVTLVMDVPANARSFAFGSGLVGRGKVWVGALVFEAVGDDVPTTAHFTGKP
jgi:hypothetical protein